MNNYLLVGIGGLIGSISRYSITLFTSGYSQQYRFPVGTLTVNLIGCFIIGIISGFLRRYTGTDQYQLFLVTGILGGFTTFSAFGLETIDMIKDQQVLFALIYVVLSTVLGVSLVWLGFKLT
jgi:CrcB protein